MSYCISKWTAFKLFFNAVAFKLYCNVIFEIKLLFLNNGINLLFFWNNGFVTCRFYLEGLFHVLTQVSMFRLELGTETNQQHDTITTVTKTRQTETDCICIDFLLWQGTKLKRNDFIIQLKSKNIWTKIWIVL